MPDVKPSGARLTLVSGALRSGPQPVATAGVSTFSEGDLRKAGLDPAVLFGWGKVAFRRVDSVRGGQLEVDGGQLPSARLGDVKPGQWLRFDQKADGKVAVKVDLRATLDGEQRWNDLFTQLSR